MRRIRVMQLLAPLTIAGAERVVLNLLRLLERERFEPHICLQLNARRPDRLVAEEVRRLGLEPEVIHLRRTFEWRQVSELAALLKRKRISLLHTHGYRTDVTGLLATRLAPLPIVATVHGWVEGGVKSRCYHLMQKIALRHFDHVIAVSDPIVAELRRFGVRPERISKITNAIDLNAPPAAAGNGLLRHKLQLPPDARLVGTVGRLSREMGLDNFLHAAARISRECPEAVFLVVGDGPERGRLEDLSARLGLSERVVFYGFCRDVAEVYPALDVFVLPSLTEGLPMSLLEAISYEVPFVATAVGEIPLLLGDIAGERLVAPGDPAALARQIQTTLKAPREARERATLLRRQLCESWDLGRWHARIAGLYERLAAGQSQA